MNKVNISEIVFDENIYPREKPADKVIEEYADALAGGAVFPPIVLEKDTNRLLDGYHRWKAHERIVKNPTLFENETNGFSEISVEFHEVPPEVTPRMYAYFLSSKHGLRPKTADAKITAEEQYKQMPGTPMTTFCKYLGVSHVTAGNYIRHLIAEFKETKRTIVARLSLLGWTQQKIADKLKELYPQADGVAQSSVNSVLSDFEDLKNLIKRDFDSGHSMETIMKRHAVPENLLWAMQLDGHTDQERFKALGWGLRTWDMWNFNDCDSRFGEDWPGRIPAQLVAHTLYFFTNPGDLVLDPTAGGGVTPDTCLAFGRKCRAYDISTRENRPEIEHHAWVQGSMQWPDAPKADLVFFDPPYYTKMAKDYEEKANGLVTPISSLSREDYLAFFTEFFSLAKENTTPAGRIAFLNADWRDFQAKAAMNESPENDITVFDYHRLLTDAGWTVTHRVECPLSTERMGGNTVLSMQANRTLGIVSRTLLIAKKG